MKIASATIFGCLAMMFAGVAGAQNAAGAQGKPYYNLGLTLSEMTPAQRTAAKEAALHQPMRPLTACMDPGNMPFSERNGEGMDTEIVKVLAQAMHTTIGFYWMSYVSHGFLNRAFGTAAEPLGHCDMIVDVPVDLPGVLTTDPIYRSTYVFAYRKDSGIDIKSLSDPALKKLRVGVYQTSGLRQALALHGIKNGLHILTVSYDTTSDQGARQQWRQVEQVVDGKLDVVGVWGPFAGYAKVRKHAPITLQPVNLMSDSIPLEFTMAIGVRESDVVLKYALDDALDASADKIKAILDSYGVPLVKCSECVVPGTLPSHGAYSTGVSSYARYVSPLPEDLTRIDTALVVPGEIVTLQDLKKSLAAGTSPDSALAQAVTASNPVRIEYLAAHGANLNAQNSMGNTPLVSAIGARDSATAELLLKLGANANTPDGSGMTPLMEAAYRDHVPSVEALLQHGASVAAKNPAGLTPLCIALENRSFLAAEALLKGGASASAPCGANGVTPLMIVATHQQARRSGNIPVDGGTFLSDGVSPIDVGRLLVSKGADVNARTRDGATALMVAAAHNNAPLIGLLVQSGAKADARSNAGQTALDIAKENGNASAVQMLDVLARFAAPPAPGAPATQH